MSENKEREAKGEMSIRTVAMPKDTNPNGDIFGGWVLSQMDLAGAIVAKQRAKGKTVTVAVDSMTFHEPVYIGDILCCYAEVTKVGTSSIEVKIEAWARREFIHERVLVTEGHFTYVAIDENRKPRAVD